MQRCKGVGDEGIVKTCNHSNCHVARNWLNGVLRTITSREYCNKVFPLIACNFNAICPAWGCALWGQPSADVAYTGNQKLLDPLIRRIAEDQPNERAHLLASCYWVVVHHDCWGCLCGPHKSLPMMKNWKQDSCHQWHFPTNKVTAENTFASCPG